MCSLAAPASAQIYNFQEVPVPSDSGYVYIGEGFFYYEGEEVVIRSGQQSVAFDTGTNIFQYMRVRVNGSAWTTIYQGPPSRTGIFEWTTPPTTPGSYAVEVNYGGDGYSYEFNLVVVPPAQRAFVSYEHNTPLPPDGALGTLKHTMLVWQGGSASLDKPLLVVEGIDGANENDPGSYYALGSTSLAPLFPRGQAEGADIVILDFGDGGRDLRANAAVVEEAISFLRVRKTSDRGLDVAGVSMGGVVARYALAKMEEEGVTHGVANFVSIDAPQQGAVLDPAFQDEIRTRPASQWPASLARPAGRQLLQYNAFDSSSPSDYSQFYADLRALNGGTGYPQLTENIGVSFGTPEENPNEGAEWMEIRIPFLPNPRYDIEGSLAQPGSLLPRDITQMWGRIAWGVFSWELDRGSDPTFIPFDSALDIGTNGQSAFELPLIHATGTPSYHDVVPPEIVGPLLNRLGYELPPPSSVSITGPGSLALLETGTFRAMVPDPGAGYQYNWEYRVFLPSCDGGGGGGEIGPLDVTCGQWHDGYGSGEVYTYSSQTSKWLELRVTATGGGGSATSPVKRVCIGNCNGNRTAHSGEDTALNSSGRKSEVEGTPRTATAASVATALGASVPAAYGIEQNYPNPFGAAAGATQTAIRFALPKASHVRLVVYDALGREVARLFDGEAGAGMHGVVFGAADLPGGVYLYRLTAGGYTETRRMTLTR